MAYKMYRLTLSAVAAYVAAALTCSAIFGVRVAVSLCAVLGTTLVLLLAAVVRQAATPLDGESRSDRLFTPLPLDSHDPAANHKVGFTSKRLARVQAGARGGVVDAVVIGSGIGGLTTAALLAKEGQVVLVLEQHDTAGGCTHTFVDRGFEFDTGVHYVGGEIWCPGKTGSRLLLDRTTSAAPSGGVHWTRMAPIVDCALQPPAAGEAAGGAWRRWPMPSGKAALRAALLARFPGEARALDAYFAAVASQQDAAGLYFAAKAIKGWLPDWLNTRVVAPLMGCRHRKLSDRTVADVLEETGASDALRSVLLYHWGNYGLVESKASWAIHAMVANHYFEGGAYPTGGSAEIARRIIPTITASGGAVLVRCPVAHIATNARGEAVGVQLSPKHGSALIRARCVIAACGAAATFGPLLAKAAAMEGNGVAAAIATPRAALADSALWGEAATSKQRSTAHVMLFVALNGTQEELALAATNYWFSTGGGDHIAAHEAYVASARAAIVAAAEGLARHKRGVARGAAAVEAARAADAAGAPVEEARGPAGEVPYAPFIDPEWAKYAAAAAAARRGEGAPFLRAPKAPFSAVFLSFPSTKDGDWSRRWPGKSTAHIIAECPYSLFAKWKDTRHRKRGAEYNALKAELSAQLLAPMLREFPHLAGRIAFAELGTPLSTSFYIGQACGESYGLAHTPARFRQQWLTPATAIPNLYLSGADVLSAGVMGAQVGGLLAAVAACPKVAWSNLRVLTKL